METKIISLKLEADSVIKRIVELTGKVEGLRAQISHLKEEFEETGQTQLGGFEETSKGIEKLNREISVNLDMIKALRKEVDSNMTAQGAVAGETTDSIRAMRGELVQLKSVYASMSKEQRESAIGQGIHEQISLLKQQIKEAERFVIVRKEETGSIRQMKAELKELKATYEGLSDVNRNSDIGTGLANQIQQIENVLKRIKADAKMTFDVSGLDLSFAADDDTKSLANLTQRIEVLTAQNKVLMQSIRELNHDEVANADALALVTQAYETNRKEISVLTAERRVLRREMENEMKLHKEEEGSLRALRAEVSRLTSQYDSMSKVRREGAEGTALLENIQKTTKELNMAEQASLRFQRNVGNYQSAFGNLNFQVQQLARELPSLSYGFNVFVGAISNNLPMLVDEVVRARREYAELMKTDPSKAVPVWKQLFSSVFSWQTALVAGITVLTLYSREIGTWIENLFKGEKAVKSFKDALDDANDTLIENADNYGESVSQFKLFQSEWGKLAGNLEGQKKLLKENKGLFDDLGISVNNATEAEKAAVDLAPNILQALLLKAQATAAYNLMVEAETKAMQKRLEAEKAMASTSVWDYWNAGIDVITNFDAVLQGVNMWDPEKYKKAKGGAFLLDADAAAKDVETYRKVYEEGQAKIKELLKDFKPATDEDDSNGGADKVRDMKAIELEEYRKAEDELLKTVKDARAREYKEMEFFYGRQIEDLKARLETEKDLSVEARQAINDQISALEQQRANKRRELSEEALQDQIEAKQAEIELKLEAVKEGTEAEYLLKLEALEKQKELDLTNAELTEEQKLLISQKYAKMRQELENEQIAEINRRQSETMQLRFESELSVLESQQYRKLDAIMKAGANEEQIKQSQAAAEMELLKLQHSQYIEELRNMKQEEGETLEEFNARQADIQRAADETQMQMTETKVQAERDAYNSLSNAIEAMGESNTEFAKLSKVLALAEIAINTGKALAAGIAQAQSVPFPANLAAIATTVATILANIATATKTVKAAKFATGGTVTGEGTATSDSIPAMLSNGESVMTAAATSMFAPVLSAFNQIGGGVPIQATETANSVAGEEMLARAFMRGAASLPNPVVSVVDINAGQKRIVQVETLANL